MSITAAPHALHAAFQEFCATVTGWDDLEPVGPYTVVSELLRNVEPAGRDWEEVFEPLCVNGADCLLALWNKVATPLAERPVVYLDSEGSPRAACANSLADLLMILPYGNLFIHQIISALDSLRDYGTLLPAKEALFTAEGRKEALTFHQATYPAQPAYVAWLTQVAGLTTAAEPAQLIRDAYYAHNVDAFLRG